MNGTIGVGFRVEIRITLEQDLGIEKPVAVTSGDDVDVLDPVVWPRQSTVLNR